MSVSSENQTDLLPPKKLFHLESGNYGISFLGGQVN